MNDPGLGDTIQKSGHEVNDARRDLVDSGSRRELSGNSRISSRQQRSAADAHGVVDGEDNSIYQSTLWWFASTAFPLFAGTFGPIANLFSVCALVQTWRVSIFDGNRVADPAWLIALNACSLVFALAANIILLFNFARRIPYNIAQPLTITFWYLASAFLLIPICLSHDERIDPTSITVAYSQSYYYALISCILYFCVSTMLLVSTLGSTVFHAYKPSFSTLTGPQRTLMLQTISFTLYLSLGAGVFAKIEGWSFADGVYWADYTLLTIGLGSDFPLETTLGRILLIPYAAFGITLIGLVVSSVRGLVLERAKTKVARRHLGKEREKWKENIKERRHMSRMNTVNPQDSHAPLTITQKWRTKWKERQLMRLPHQFAKAVPDPLKRQDQRGPWHRAEFELMRFIEENTEYTERYAALTMSFLVILVVWIGGSLIFWSCEHNSQSWTYTESLYFSYTTLLTIGYGDFYPNSSAGKPFFVVWSLISVPAMTVLISNMGDTVVKWVQDVTVWASKWTILPERDSPTTPKKKGKRKHTNKLLALHHKSEDHHPNSHSEKPSKISTEDKKSDEKGAEDSRTLEHDIEHLGEHVEGFEEEEGRGGSLAARLAREIAHLAKDLRSKPPKKYTWEEWARWLEMLGERESGGRSDVPKSPGGESTTSQHPAPEILVATSLGDGSQPKTVVDSHKLEVPSHSRLGVHRETTHDTNDTRDEDKSVTDHDWRWTWLDDQGPLFSKLTETEWVVEKLCFRLEEVLEDEIREARAGARKSSTDDKT